MIILLMCWLTPSCTGIIVTSCAIRPSFILFFLKITCRLTFQLNPPSVAGLNLSWEEIWLRIHCLFYAIKKLFCWKFVLKGLKAYWSVNSERERGNSVKEWENKTGVSEGRGAETDLLNMSIMSAYTLGMHVCLLWPISKRLPNAAILVSIWGRTRSIIN